MAQVPGTDGVSTYYKKRPVTMLPESTPPEEEEEKITVGYGGMAKAKPVYTPPQLSGPTSQRDVIDQMYDAARVQQETALKANYEENAAQLDREEAGIAPTYQKAANEAATQAALSRRSFQEQAAASGLNSGAVGQAALAQNNALQANLSGIRQAEADARAQLNSRRSQLRQEYKNAVAEAIAKNDLERARVLYQEAQRVDNALLDAVYKQALLDEKAWKINH